MEYEDQKVIWETLVQSVLQVHQDPQEEMELKVHLEYQANRAHLEYLENRVKRV